MSRPVLLQGREKKKFPLFSVLFTVVVFLVILLFLFEIWFLNRFTPIRVDGDSMEHTLQDDDWLYADSKAEPKRGDIVIVYVKDSVDEYGQPLFKGLNERGQTVAIEYIIKRVIGLEGDELYAERNGIYLKKKGETEFSLLEEPYVYLDPTKGPLSFGSERDPVKVGAGELFVMGDNRLNSYDSADVGAVPAKNVTGVVPDWAIGHKGAITAWESFRDRFRRLK